MDHFCVVGWSGTARGFDSLVRRAVDEYGLRGDLLYDVRNCPGTRLDPTAEHWRKRLSGEVLEMPWSPNAGHDRRALREGDAEVDSDEVVSREIMNGSALMANCRSQDVRMTEAGILEPLDALRCLRPIVRKYWLAQHVAGELGKSTVSHARFVKGNARHLRVDWSTGMTVFVNRATNDWDCATGDGGLGTVRLPPCGFVAFNAKTDRYAAIRRRGGRIVEESAYSEGKKVVRYLNPRGADTPVDFGWIRTTEAFRLITEPGKPDLKIPLP